MDLAQALSMTVEQIEATMSVSELGLWQRYSAWKGFAWRRLELHLASITQAIAVTMGGAQPGPLQPYLIDPPAGAGGDGADGVDGADDVNDGADASEPDFLATMAIDGGTRRLPL